MESVVIQQSRVANTVIIEMITDEILTNEPNGRARSGCGAEPVDHDMVELSFIANPAQPRALIYIYINLSPTNT